MNYSRRTIGRAKRAVNCSPVQMSLLDTMQMRSVALFEIAGLQGVDHRFTSRPLSERVAERSLLWLMQVGLLRREVDGQGLTDSFRLTPLGRILVEQWRQQQHLFSQVSWSDRLRNWGRRLLAGFL